MSKRKEIERRVLAAALRWGKACEEVAGVRRAKMQCRVVSRDWEDPVPACSETTPEDLDRMFGTDRSGDPTVEENCVNCYRAHGNRHLKPSDVDAMRRERTLAYGQLRRAVMALEKVRA